MAQIDFKTVDQKTYSFYQKAAWDSLIAVGKQAKKHQIDYFYLNYRMGIAYFYKNMFYSASFYLEKAAKQNTAAHDDAFFNKHLYLSYIYTLRYGKAMEIPIDSSNAELIGKMRRSHIVVFGGGGSAFPIDYEDLQKKGDEDLLFSQFQQGQTLWAIAAGRQIFSWLSLDLSYSNLQFFDVISADTDDSLTIRTSTIKQQNISLLPEIRINDEWQFRLAFAYSFDESDPYNYFYYSPGDPNMIVKGKYEEQTYLLGANIYRQFRNFRMGLEFGTSNYSHTNQYQFGLNVMYYPFSNLNLYSFTSASVKYESSKANFVFHQDIGFKIASKFWMEVGGTFGEMNHYNVFSLGYGYNTPDHINMLINAKLIYLLGENVELFIDGRFYKRHDPVYQLYIDKPYKQGKLNYNYWNVNGGLIWKFKK